MLFSVSAYNGIEVHASETAQSQSQVRLRRSATVTCVRPGTACRVLVTRRSSDVSNFTSVSRGPRDFVRASFEVTVPVTESDENENENDDENGDGVPNTDLWQLRAQFESEERLTSTNDTAAHARRQRYVHTLFARHGLLGQAGALGPSGAGGSSSSASSAGPEGSLSIPVSFESCEGGCGPPSPAEVLRQVSAQLLSVTPDARFSSTGLVRRQQFSNNGKHMLPVYETVDLSGAPDTPPKALELRLTQLACVDAKTRAIVTEFLRDGSVPEDGKRYRARLNRPPSGHRRSQCENERQSLLQPCRRYHAKAQLGAPSATKRTDVSTLVYLDVIVVFSL